jgi:hypothetical protein
MTITIHNNDAITRNALSTSSIKKIAAAGGLAAAVSAAVLLFGSSDPIPATPVQASVSAQQIASYESLQTVAQWAGENGFTGLSPASLRSIEGPFSAYESLSAVADWAQDNGYSGLSPASMQIVDQ